MKKKTKIILWAIGIIVALIVIYIVVIPLVFCTNIDFDYTKNPEYIFCSQDSDCIPEECGCLNKKGARKFFWFFEIFCGLRTGCLSPTSCTCENNQCQSHYDYGNDVEQVFNLYLQAGQNCDIDLANSIITEKSKEIVRFTCSNMANEVKCYVGRDYEIRVKEDTAVLYLTPFSHGIENPFFFSKENGEWKMNLYKMWAGLVMVGSTCDSGWGWRSQELADEFCSYFEPGECPDK